MGLDDLVRTAIATAKTVTADLQVSVTHAAFSSVDGYGKPSYASGVSRKALVESANRLIRTAAGQEVLSRTKVTFLSPVSVTTKDRITLPDGSTGPILDVRGLVDPSTSAPYMVEVFLG